MATTSQRTSSREPIQINAARASDLPTTGSSLPAKLAELLGGKVPNLAIHDLERARDQLATAVQLLKKSRDEELRLEATAPLKDNPKVKGWQQAMDYFASADGAPLYACQSIDPVGDMDTFIGELAGLDFHWQTVAVDADIDPGAARRIANVLAQRKTAGAFVDVKTSVDPGKSFDELLNRLVEKPLISGVQGFERIQSFVGYVKSADADSHGVARRRCLGAALGAQARADQINAGEVPAGDRGGMGILHGVEVCERYLQEERCALVEHGLNPLRKWRKVAPAVAYGNRTLLDNAESRYQFANCTHLLNQLMAEFFITTQHHILFAPRTRKATVEAELGVMKRRMDKLVDDGWLAASDIWVSYDDLTLNINFMILPPPPANEVVLNFMEEMEEASR